MKARNEGACNIVCMKTLFFVFSFLFWVSQCDQLTTSFREYGDLSLSLIVFIFLVNVLVMWHFKARLKIHVEGS